MAQGVSLKRFERGGEYASLVIAWVCMIAGIVHLVLPQFIESRAPGLLLTALGVLIGVAIWDRRTDREKYRQVDESLKRLEPLVSVAQSALSADIVGLYSGRNDEKAQASIRQLLSDTETKRISIAATALPAFFHPGKTYNEIVRRSLERGVEFRVLLLDPRGQAANQRAERELATATVKDIERSISIIQEYIDCNLPIEARIYDFPPQVYMIQSDSLVFMEPYHFGRVLSKVNDQPVGGCIGGLVPCYVARKNPGREQRDGIWDVMNDHFEYLWTDAYPDGQPLTLPIYSALRIDRYDLDAHTVLLTNRHPFTSVNLAGWSLRAAWIEDSYSHSRGVEILDFPEDKVIRARDSIPFKTRLGRQLVEELSEAAKGDGSGATPGRIYIELINRRDALVGRFPNDGFMLEH
ncbi:MAG TPA: hypothetical protein VMJ64_06895 [Anaerolineales bacterium]|nr:hypothetical protein [Anaerolineales bacterium]